MRKSKQERIERVRQMYEHGMSVIRIANEIGCAVSTVSQYLKESGVKELRTAELAKKIIEMYKDGATVTRIKNELGISSTFVYAILKKNGLKKKCFLKAEIDLIDENTKFAEDRLANLLLEKVMIDGKIYEDMSPVFLPR